mgnify:CR=1 FL=1
MGAVGRRGYRCAWARPAIPESLSLPEDTCGGRYPWTGLVPRALGQPPVHGPLPPQGSSGGGMGVQRGRRMIAARASGGYRSAQPTLRVLVQVHQAG